MRIKPEQAVEHVRKPESIRYIRQDRQYIPEKVTERAAILGAHFECLENGYEGSCDTCRHLVHDTLDYFYGQALTSTDAMIMILNDILEDRENNTL